MPSVLSGGMTNPNLLRMAIFFIFRGHIIFLDALASLRPIMKSGSFTFLRLLQLELGIVSDCFNNQQSTMSALPTMSTLPTISLLNWEVFRCASIS